MNNILVEIKKTKNLFKAHINNLRVKWNKIVF